MTNDQELRSAILQLVKAGKQYQARALSLNVALSAILKLPPTKRAELTPDMVHAEVAQARTQAAQIVDKLSAPLEEALSGSSDFLEILRAYAAQFWYQ